MLYEELLLEAEMEGLEIEEREFNARIKGLYIEGVIALNSSITTRSEKTCVLAEEIGHYYMTIGNILDQSKPENRKQERQARAWAYNRLIGLEGLINAHENGAGSISEIAEFLGVSDRFLCEALQYYYETYGLTCKVDDYIICFSPVKIFKKISKGGEHD